ncbi:monofunctional biosynthetic peptidoglycan transglycosylase [Ectothiorhodospira marina]|uniref:monofunctional biosynthetic peptidoglycan transglycosylase n=1 Tax=Ectothiorhodospira marina TaxID=1396821 RepID=UPI000B7F29BA|nr:monofunctional biosynthetic peptidoglycan transglycosylase [Ectothiorhodospira marina]
MRRNRPPYRRWSFRRLMARLLVGIALVLLVSTTVVIGGLRWMDPPTTAFILRHENSSATSGYKVPVRHEWVSREHIAPEAAYAVIAAEDQNFMNHRGFDFGSIRAAIREYRAGGRLRGASTISQQAAKNVFLWPERSLLRKGVEAYLTVFIEWLWPKQRILEVYLNAAQFGPNIYGVEAASQAYFDKPASALTQSEAARLAAVLPGPVRLRANQPSSYVLERQAWIEHQVPQLKKAGYLKGVWGPPERIMTGTVPENRLIPVSDDRVTQDPPQPLLFSIQEGMMTTLINLHAPDETARWHVINDGVMGGLSRSRFDISEDGVAVFTGEISLANSGGFASVRRAPEALGMGQARGIRLQVRGDGRTYQLRLRSDTDDNAMAYRQHFATTDRQWQEVQLPFSRFEPVYRGRVLPDAPLLDPARIRQVGFMLADKAPGPFVLEIGSVDLME